MLKKSIEKAFNEQVNAETYSAYLYWAMAAWCEKSNLPGFANWMRVQAQEEMAHAVIFYNHIVERAGTVKLAAIDAPPSTWKDIRDVFEYTLKHEQHVTSLINDRVELTTKEKDYAGVQFLQWFVNEQVEEEKNAEQILAKLEMIGKEGPALYMLDKEMTARTFALPAPLQGGAQ